MKEEKQISTRERITIILVVFLIQMVKPWQYDHQFKNFWEELKEVINTK